MRYIVAKYTEDRKVKNYIVYDSITCRYGYTGIDELEKYKLERLDSIEEKCLPEVNIEYSNRIFSTYADKKYLHQKFNKLTVDFFCTEYIDGMNQFRWMCSCDCTSEPKTYRPDKVVNGRAKSCGCQGQYADKKFIGQVINGVKVLEIDVNHNYYQGEGTGWVCECPGCHERFPASARRVLDGRVKSCGDSQCHRDLHLKENKYGDSKYLKKTFGYLTVEDIRYGEIGGYKGFIWDCSCKCGGKASFLGYSIAKGNNKSCGCIRSFHELLIREILDEYNISYETEFKFENLYGINGGSLRFDFKIYINENDFILLEYQGNQHFDYSRASGWNIDDLLLNDNIKRDFCKKNNLKLIELKGKYTKEKMKTELKKLGIIA